jgi:ABC-2 type transport system permease protein
MNPALRYLLARSFGNALRARIARLRQPKYLAGAVLGAAYFYFYFYRFLFGGAFVKGPRMFSDALWPHIGATLLLVATVVFSWIVPASRAVIAFTEAEIAFLFPAPITRRVLIIHKLLKSQLTLLILAVLITLLTGRFRAGSEAWFRMGGWWLILNTLNLHRIGASFALQRLKDHGMSDWKRRGVALLVIAGVSAAIYFAPGAIPAPPSLMGDQMPDYGAYVARLATESPLAYVLAPFRWVVQPYFARDGASFLQALGPAFTILLLHFIWVLRADISFEEASISAAQRRAAFLAAHRKGEFRVRKSGKSKRPVWRLAATGFAPTAFLWKACLKFGGRRAFTLWTFLFVVLFAAAGLVRDQLQAKPSGPVLFVIIAICVICYASLLISLVMIGQQASAQLRQAMASLDVVKTYPIPGWQVAIGELLGAVAVGTLLQWAALAVASFLASGIAVKAASGMTYLLIGTGALAVLLPAFNLATAILPSAAALMFPGWFRPQDATGHGLENTGLRLMIGIGQLLAMAIAILPVAFFGACAWFAAQAFHLDLVWQASGAIGIGGLILAMEAGLGVAWLGSLYDGYDLSQVS